MTSSLDFVTSESPDVSTLIDESISSNVDVTTAGDGRQGTVRRHVPMIVRVTVLLTLSVFNLSGNGFTLITIRKTPRLWTKTNFILASMLVADFTTAILTFWYTSFVLVVYVFSNPCRYNTVITALTPLMKITIYVSCYHQILVSVERYIAIVYPLHYETKFTDRTMKWGISTAWAAGICIGMSFALWVIDAEPRKCVLIPDHYQLVDFFFVYIPICVTMFTSYGKILAVWWRQRERIEPMNSAPEHPQQTTTFTTVPATQSGNATTGDNADDPKDKPLTRTGSSGQPNAAPSEELTQQQQHRRRQKMKSRRREFKAVYLSAAIVGTFVILWFPHNLGRVLSAVGYDPYVVDYVTLAAGAIGLFNFSFTWAIYAAVSKSYRRAYRQMLIRIGCCCCKNITLQVDNIS